MLPREDFSTAKCIALSEEIAHGMRRTGVTKQEFMYTLERSLAAFCVDHNMALDEVFHRMTLHAFEFAEKKKGRIWTP
jgi:hypothetical protein